MSLLGFDAVGRSALGQISHPGATNFILAALTGTYALTGNAASLCRDFVNWLPITSQSETWTAQTAQSESWTPKTEQDETWTENPATVNTGEACS